MNPTELTPKQQTSEAVRQANTILILTGQHPSVDQVAATIALTAILRKFGKKVTAIISDPLPTQVQFLTTSELDKDLTGQRDFVLKVDISRTPVDQFRYAVEEGKLNIYLTPSKGSFAPSDVTFAYGDYQYDLAIVLGVPTRARIDKMYAANPELFTRLPIASIDFHRSNENYGAINLIDGTASSLCEILVALSESLQSGLIDETIATTMLAGIMASTDRFTATHTTSKSLTVAAQMMAAGAKQQDIVRSLFRDGRSTERVDNRPARPTTPRVEAKPAEPAAQTPTVNVEGPVARLNAETAPAQNVTPEPVIEASAPVVTQPIEPDNDQLDLDEADFGDLIIDPNHIEVEPEADEDLTETMAEHTPAELAHSDIPETPLQEIPMADFASAAEILANRDETPTEA